MDVRLTFNNAPDLIDPKYATTLRLVLALAGRDEKMIENTRSMGSIEFTRPLSNIDVKLQVK